jgi:N-acetylmuramoyl-L-alanine amidase
METGMGRLLRRASGALLVSLALWLAAGGSALAVDFGDPGARMRAYWLNGKLVVGVSPLANEGYIQIARRVMERPEDYAAIVAFNKERPVLAGTPVNFPIASLRPELRGNALRALYPEDELTERGWSHHVTDPLESLIQLTEAYTGSMSRFKELARYNRLSNPNLLRMGDEVVIPLHWMPDALGFRPLGLKAPLTLEKDAGSGRIYAGYSVHRDDTFYSLLLRFTERERAEELNRMAGLLLKINGIRDETRLPAGRTLRIPIEWIGEEYLVSGFAKPAPGLEPPRRPPLKRGAALQPIHVIVDAGHGGSDPGAVYGRRGARDHVYEHELVYDVSLRLLRLLESKGYPAYPTMEDPDQPAPAAVLSTQELGSERVRVTPPYRMDSAKVAVNMRVFLINALYARLTGQDGVEPENVVLVSIHGDALAPTLRGAMVYYPDHRLRVAEFQPRGRVYRIRQEALPSLIRFRQDDNREAEENSRGFGELIVRAFRQRRLGVSGRKPVRPYYYRDGERTLPAVLRYSPVPTSVLVEVANLNNRADRLQMLQPAARQQVAQGLLDALELLRAERRSLVASRKAS